MKKYLLIMVIALLVLPNAIAEEEYYEDIDIIAIGHCTSVYHFHRILNVDYLPYCGFGIEGDTPFKIKDKVYLVIDDDTVRILSNDVVFMHNATGIFFWNHLSIRGRGLPFAPILFVKCKADRLWIRSKD